MFSRDGCKAHREEKKLGIYITQCTAQKTQGQAFDASDKSTTTHPIPTHLIGLSDMHHGRHRRVGSCTGRRQVLQVLLLRLPAAAQAAAARGLVEHAGELGEDVLARVQSRALQVFRFRRVFGICM
jgi:hypothetical protein